MAEYIDREVAINLLSHPVTASMCMTAEQALIRAEQRRYDADLISKIPVADVQPVVHGEWIWDANGMEPWSMGM